MTHKRNIYLLMIGSQGNNSGVMNHAFCLRFLSRAANRNLKIHEPGEIQSPD